jgi:hypothetical protein
MADQRKSEPRKDAGSEEQKPARGASEKASPEEIEKFKVKESRNGMPGYGQPDVKK